MFKLKLYLNSKFTITHCIAMSFQVSVLHKELLQGVHKFVSLIYIRLVLGSQAGPDLNATTIYVRLSVG